MMHIYMVQDTFQTATAIIIIPSPFLAQSRSRNVFFLSVSILRSKMIVKMKAERSKSFAISDFCFNLVAFTQPCCSPIIFRSILLETSHSHRGRQKVEQEKFIKESLRWKKNFFFNSLLYFFVFLMGCPFIPSETVRPSSIFLPHDSGPPSQGENNSGLPMVGLVSEGLNFSMQKGFV